LPFMENQPLHDSINFERVLDTSCYAHSQPHYFSNPPASQVRIESYECPSEAQPMDGANAPTNYAGVWGSHANAFSSQIHVLGVFGMSNRVQTLTMASINDGTSTTVMVGEVFRGAPYWRTTSGNHTGQRCRRWIAETGYCGCDTSYPPNFYKQSAAVCANNPPLDGIADNNPGNLHKDCPNKNCCPDIVEWVDNHNNGNRGRRPLSSLHPGGAQGAYADGSVKFIPDSVDTVVWRNTGTRFGGDTPVFTGQ
jgi:prepilin-type processing-associated H-X9-DG protein